MRTAIGFFLIVAMIPATSFGFDGKRRGFILGGGIGVGMTSYSIDYHSTGVTGGTDDGSEPGFEYADIRIGYGFSEQFLLYYGTLGLMSSSLSTWISGPGFSWYVAEERPVYVTALAGFVYTVPDHLDGLGDGDAIGAEHGGFGGAIGAGWEFVPHWSLEANIGFSRASRDEKHASWDFFSVNGPAVDTDAWMFLLTLNALAY